MGLGNALALGLGVASGRPLVSGMVAKQVRGVNHRKDMMEFGRKAVGISTPEDAKSLYAEYSGKLSPQEMKSVIDWQKGIQTEKEDRDYLLERRTRQKQEDTITDNRRELRKEVASAKREWDANSATYENTLEGLKRKRTDLTAKIGSLPQGSAALDIYSKWEGSLSKVNNAISAMETAQKRKAEAGKKWLINTETGKGEWVNPTGDLSGYRPPAAGTGKLDQRTLALFKDELEYNRELKTELGNAATDEERKDLNAKISDSNEKLRVLRGGKPREVVRPKTGKVAKIAARKHADSFRKQVFKNNDDKMQAARVRIAALANEPEVQDLFIRMLEGKPKGEMPEPLGTTNKQTPSPLGTTKKQTPSPLGDTGWLLKKGPSEKQVREAKAEIKVFAKKVGKSLDGASNILADAAGFTVDELLLKPAREIKRLWEALIAE